MFPGENSFNGVTKKVICLRGLAAVQPYEAAQPKLILASSTIIYEQSGTAKINFFSKNPCPY